MRRPLCLLLLLLAPGGLAGATPPTADPPPEELRVLVARRLHQALGTAVRIKDLRYEILSSTFVGSGIEVGPRARPQVTLDGVRLEQKLFAAGGRREIVLLTAQRPRITIPSAWLERPLAILPPGPVLIRAARLSQGQITVVCQSGARVSFEGLELELKELVIDPGAARRALRLRGSGILRLGRVTFAGLVLRDLHLKIKLDGDRLDLTVLQARGPGKLDLRGTLSISGNRLGAIALQGAVDLRPAGAGGARLWGPVSLRGPSLTAPVLEGKLRSQGAFPRQGGTDPAPDLRMRLRVGGKNLRGTLGGWQVR